MIIDGLTDAPDTNWRELRWAYGEMVFGYMTSDVDSLDVATCIGAAVMALTQATMRRRIRVNPSELFHILGALGATQWELRLQDLMAVLEFIVNEYQREDGRGT